MQLSFVPWFFLGSISDCLFNLGIFYTGEIPISTHCDNLFFAPNICVVHQTTSATSTTISRRWIIMQLSLLHAYNGCLVRTANKCRLGLALEDQAELWRKLLVVRRCRGSALHNINFNRSPPSIFISESHIDRATDTAIHRQVVDGSFLVANTPPGQRSSVLNNFGVSQSQRQIKTSVDYVKFISSVTSSLVQCASPWSEISPGWWWWWWCRTPSSSSESNYVRNGGGNVHDYVYVCK